MTKLKRKATGELVDAELHTKLLLTDLHEAESAWGPCRRAIIDALIHAGVPKNDCPQHLNWDWDRKLTGKSDLDIGGALSPLRLMGVKCDGEWQGLILTTCIGHQSRMANGGRDLLYVVYLETAPWNLEISEIGQDATLSGIGRQLMELAVRLSKSLGLRGRIGLHALPQSEGFYNWCGMTDFGVDQGYQNLRYFEMTDGQANAFLNPGRTTR